MPGFGDVGQGAIEKEGDYRGKRKWEHFYFIKGLKNRQT